MEINNQVPPVVSVAPSTQVQTTQISLMEVFQTTLSHWKWIVFSVVVCLCLAVLYLARTPNVYTRSAAIEIKDENNGATNSAMATFADMGLTTGNTNLYNEMAYFQSPDLMEKVVKRLKLDISYSTRKGLKQQPLYGATLPINVSFPTMVESKSATVEVHVAPGGKITLSDLKMDGEKYEYTMSKPVAFGTKISTPIGVVVVDKTPYYDPDEDYNIRVNRSSLKGAVATWTGRLEVKEQKNDGTVIDLSITDASAQKAEDVLNALIEAYNEQWILDKNQIAVSTSNFINERLGVIENELGTVDQDISSYKSAHMIPDVAQTAAMYVTENQETSQKLVELGNRLQMTRYLREHLMKDARNDHVLPANTGIENTSIEKLIADYNQLVLQRNSLVANSSETNPLVTDIDARLGSMRTSIVASIDNQIKALSTDISNLRGSQGALSARIAASPTQAKYLLSVERQQKVKESLYLYLLQKREENELNQAFTAYNTRIITRPTGVPQPTGPQRTKILGLAFIVGLLIPFGVEYVKAINNTKVRGRKDLKNVTAPFLGELPVVKVKRGENKDTMMVVQPANRNVINEAFRVVRTNLNFMLQGDKELPGARRIMITSFNPGSGKTFITLNLGMSLAIRGAKVLVIDCDLRRGSAGAFVGSPKVGLTQYLSGQVKDINEVVMKFNEDQSLYVIPAGKLPPNPTELIENGRLDKAVQELSAEYDYIFFDCPPMEMIGDARIINTLTERTIVVVRAGVFERSMIPEIEKIYQEKKYRNVAVLLNGCSGVGAYRYAYGYSQGKNYYHK
ncbi:MAG: polysaccharide biosynthesis tyrosine autokinase [Muribaculaceae bacterium]|nr:polysaccharide biosynthesis tyrosine autokinase [Muribaculaceae bacterium]